MASTADSSTGRKDNAVCRVLIVDDEAPIQCLFSRILSSADCGLETDVAGDGSEAVRSFAEDRQDVVLMDLHMPVMDGITAYHKIESLCAERQWRMPAVVFCTGFAPPAILGEILHRHPGHAFLPKPVSAEQLLETVLSRAST